MKPRISIVTCSYNQAAFIRATLLSVLNQDIEGLEYLVIDGASTDGSIDIIRQLESRITTWISEPDSGQSDALNKGLMLASGDIVGWLCSDDILLPDALAEVVEFFDSHPEVDAIYGNAIIINEDGRPLRMKREIKFYPWILTYDHNYVPQPSMFWRRKLHEHAGYLRNDLHFTMDLELWLRFYAAGANVRHVNKCWSGMRRHGNQKVFTQTGAIRRENALLRKEYASAGAPVLPDRLIFCIARLVRVLLKSLQGGYISHLPPYLKFFLAQLHKDAKAP
jgi:glycosyltransferase involved in cell wall biosynthesis